MIIYYFHIIEQYLHTNMNIGGALYDSSTGGVFGNMDGYKNYKGSGTNAVIAGGALGLASSSGSGNIERCPLNDTSFYCQLSKGTNIISMVLYIMFVITTAMYFLYFLYNFVRNGKTSKRK